MQLVSQYLIELQFFCRKFEYGYPDFFSPLLRGGNFFSRSQFYASAGACPVWWTFVHVVVRNQAFCFLFTATPAMFGYFSNSIFFCAFWILKKFVIPHALPRIILRMNQMSEKKTWSKSARTRTIAGSVTSVEPHLYRVSFFLFSYFPFPPSPPSTYHTSHQLAQCLLIVFDFYISHDGKRESNKCRYVM